MSHKILVADTDPLARETLREAAGALGVECLFASTEEEAFQRFVEVGPEVVFADALLPRKGAFELLKRIRSAPAGGKTPVYVTSALRATADLRDEATKVWNARGVLVKPLDAQAVRAELQKALPAAAAEEADWILLAKVGDEGTFDRASFPLVFAHAYRLGRPCRLALSNGKVRKVLTFAGKNLVFAQSNVFSETLARFLLDRGMVKEKVYQEAIRRALETGVRIGEAFVALKAADTATIDTCVRRNILDKTLDLFTWNEGGYRIIPHEPPPADIPGGPIPGDSLLWTVVREQLPARALTQALAPLAQKRLLTDRPLSELPGPAQLGELAAKLRNFYLLAPGRPVAEMLAEQPELGATFLFYLLLAGFLAAEGLEEEPPPADPAMRKLLREAQRTLEWTQGRNAFQVLGVALDADDQAVAAAFEALSARFGPQAEPPDAPAAVTRAMKSLHRVVRHAYHEIMTADARAAHLSEIAGEAGGEGANALRAETAFREGVSALRRRDWDAARESFAHAASLNPVESEYLMYIGIARMRQTTPSPEAAMAEAEEAIWKAHAAAPHNPEPLYQIGQIALKRKQWERAEDLFERALRLKTDHERARDGLIRVRAKLGKSIGDKIGSLFSR